MSLTLEPNERDPNVLWAEIHRLRADMEGPSGFSTWKDAAIAERLSASRARAALLLKGVRIDRGALQAAINMLERDGQEGFAVRGELAEELKRAITGELA